MDIPDGIPNAFQIIQYTPPARPALQQPGAQPEPAGFYSRCLQAAEAPDALSLRGEIQLLRLLIRRVVEASERDAEQTSEQAGKTLNLCNKGLALLARLIHQEAAHAGSDENAAEALHQALLDLASNPEFS